VIASSPSKAGVIVQRLIRAVSISSRRERSSVQAARPAMRSPEAGAPHYLRDGSNACANTQPTNAARDLRGRSLGGIDAVRA
jgi:type II secretory ATPase GspE/PulE/Tfp pilus assembly ATPase PilB-like protein